MSKHTPAPWGISEEYEDGVIGSNGETVFSGNCYSSVEYNRINEEADKALILTAPELLDILDTIIKKYFNNTEAHNIEEITEARKVIAKARGES